MDWSLIASVIVVNIVLSGDNALAIAMACKNLQPNHRKTVLLLGSIGAIFMQILLTYTAALLLAIPYLKIIGGAVLTWVAVKLLLSNQATLTKPIENLELLPTILKIIVANTIMSLDNVLAIAVITGGNPLLLGIGLLVSFPVIISGSSMVAGILDKYSLIMWLGALFLGWTAGGIIAADSFIARYLDLYEISPTNIAVLFALIVVTCGLVGKNNASDSMNEDSSDRT